MVQRADSTILRTTGARWLARRIPDREMWDRAHVSSLCWLLRQDSHSASPNPGVCDEPAYHPGKVTILYVPQRPELQLCKQPELCPKGFR